MRITHKTVKQRRQIGDYRLHGNKKERMQATKWAASVEMQHSKILNDGKYLSTSNLYKREKYETG